MRSKTSTTLILEVIDGNKCIQLPIQHLSNNIMSCHFSGSKILINLLISFHIFSKVIISWGDSTLRNALLRNEATIKSVLRINPYKAF